MVNKKMNVALIDDEAQNNHNFMARFTEEFNFHPHVTSDQLLQTMSLESIDLFVIDVHMPIEDGFLVANKIMRSVHYKGEPLLFVTFDESLPVIARCLAESGADYVSRNTNSAEIKARIQKLIEKKRAECLKLGSLEINPRLVQATMNGKPLDLTLKEFKILTFLLTRKDQRIHRDYLQRHVWGDVSVTDKTLNSHFTNLRAKLAECELNLTVDRQGLVELSQKSV